MNSGQSTSSPDPKSTGPTPQTADPICAVNAFLLDREFLLPVVASRLGSDATFESAIRGSSMAPAIPKLSRLRVQLLGTRIPEAGEILYYLTDDGFVIHRVVHHVSARSGERFYITIGDNCLAPDQPVPERRVLGTVIAVETKAGMRPPRLPQLNSALHRLVRGISIPMTIVASYFGVAAASHVSTRFRWLEDVARARAGRVLRFVGLLRGR